MKITPCSRLIRGLSEDETKSFVGMYQEAKKVIEALVDALNKDLDKAVLDSERASAFECPNWELKQSYEFGYRQALRHAIQLISPKVDHDLHK